MLRLKGSSEGMFLKGLKGTGYLATASYLAAASFSPLDSNDFQPSLRDYSVDIP